MPTYVVWELQDLDPLGKEALSEYRGFTLEAVDIRACADQVRRRKAFIKRGVKKFLIVERGHHILPGGGPLQLYGAQRAARARARSGGYR